MGTHSAGLVEPVRRQYADVGIEAAHGDDHALVHRRRLQARGRRAPLLPVLRLAGGSLRIREGPPLQEAPPCAPTPVQAQMLLYKAPCIRKDKFAASARLRTGHAIVTACCVHSFALDAQAAEHMQNSKPHGPGCKL